MARAPAGIHKSLYSACSNMKSSEPLIVWCFHISPVLKKKRAQLYPSKGRCTVEGLHTTSACCIEFCMVLQKQQSYVTVAMESSVVKRVLAIMVWCINFCAELQ